jgi:3-keto-disaccharide hydrolase
MTGRGSPKWTVERDDTAPSKGAVLKQSGKATYPLALKEGTSLKDGFVEVKFKPISGSEDRAGGVVWRAKDASNYYVVRANALEDNVVVYKTVNGARSSLDIVGRKGGYGVKVPVPANQWHTLRVEFAGTRFKVAFNGQPQFEVEDATFVEPLSF